MSLEVKIPALGESINSGVLAKWHVQDGDVVKKDQPLYELETDKITSEGNAEAAGKITLKVSEGTEVKIGEVVALIDETSTAEAPAADPKSKSGAEAKTAEAPAAAKSGPAVRRIAAETGIDPANVAGTGKDGRVTKGDMLKAETAPKKLDVSAGKETVPVKTTVAGTSPGTERQTRKKLSPLRARIAERLVQAQHEAAMLTTFNEVDMSTVMELRKKYQDDFVKKHGVKLGFMSFFAKAVVHGLQEVPAINSQLEGDSLVQNHYYDIGVAVSTPKGLMVPVIRDCDQLGMAGIEKQIAAVAQRARDGKITLDDLTGGVFTITNGGIFGSMLSTPIINPPQSAILGLHAINEKPMAVNGQVVIRPMMYLAVSYDHRVVDGKEAVTFLVKVKQVIEDPARLLIGA
ncbi:MAG: 2-oxoglutarate dehydrogenase complex dihydrolipoyllysine-residue succinyltransferase [Cephaloticoccus sp.]|nr:2-oxoglutarate dehydrogenase complex dihydrolipoyllysine-residue succinyltransferase [Cephaloticoccus sp.]MCF7761623.1 2-oxoglutarate dehydrogenase complex dihydrolipoyllysine-residue succinyltransferase [Cephaloticoccus sp.]